MLFVAGLALSAASGTARADEFANLPNSDILPEGTIKVSGVVPGMGEHWANPKDLPLGPIYCVYKGKIVCLEFMMSQADLAAGESWPNLNGLKDLPSVNHVHLGFMPKGHEGYEIPHYDLHIYFVSPEALQEIKAETEHVGAK